MELSEINTISFICAITAKLRKGTLECISARREHFRLPMDRCCLTLNRNVGWSNAIRLNFLLLYGLQDTADYCPKGIYIF